MTDRELERLYDAYAGGLFHYLLSFTKTEADARDLLQELFIKLAKDTADQEPLQSERAWLYRMAHNLAVDSLRRRKVRSDAHQQMSLEKPDGYHGNADPDRALLAQRFGEAMAALPDDQRVVMQLKLWEDFTFEEIAQAQSIPLNTAASRYRYGLEKLRSLLRPLYEEMI